MPTLNNNTLITQYADDLMDTAPDLMSVENSSASDTKSEDEDAPGGSIGKCRAWRNTFTGTSLIAANVVIPDEADPLSKTLIDYMSELEVDRLPDPQSSEDLCINKLMETAVRQVHENDE